MRRGLLLLFLFTPALFGRQSADTSASPQDSIAASRNALLLRFRISTYDPLRQSLLSQPPVELDSSIRVDPSLRPSLLRERLTALPPPGDVARTQNALQKQLLELSKLTPFEQSSLAMKRQKELFGHQPELRNRFYQTDIIKVLEWINGWFR